MFECMARHGGRRRGATDGAKDASAEHGSPAIYYLSTATNSTRCSLSLADSHQRPSYGTVTTVLDFSSSARTVVNRLETNSTLMASTLQAPPLPPFYLPRLCYAVSHFTPPPSPLTNNHLGYPSIPYLCRESPSSLVHRLPLIHFSQFVGVIGFSLS